MSAERLDRYAEEVWTCFRAGRITGTEAESAARAVMAVADAEQAELMAEVARLRGAIADNEQAFTKRVVAWGREKDRAEKAEAIVARVEALADEWAYDVRTLRGDYDQTGTEAALSYANCTAMDLSALRAALRGSQ